MNAGVPVKLRDLLRTRAIPEHLRGVFKTRRYTNPRLPYLSIPHPVYLERIRVKFIYEGHPVMVKVIGAKGRKSLLPQCNGRMSMKLATNIQHVSGNCWQSSQVQGNIEALCIFLAGAYPWWWRRGVAVERRIRDREVGGSGLSRALRRKNSGQVSHT